VSLFTEMTRTDPSPASYGESHFDFLDRVAGQYWEAIRVVVEKWYSRFPVEHQPRIRSRLRGRQPDYWGAYWELLLHSTMLGLGLEVTVDPVVAAGRTPDFLVAQGDDECLIEATVILEPGSDQTSDSRQAPVLNMLSSLELRYHYLHVVDLIDGPKTPPLAKLRDGFQGWIDGVEKNPPESDAASKVLRPRRAAHLSDWVIEVELIPRSPSRYRLKAGIDMGPSRSRFVNDHSDISKAMSKKAKRYRSAAAPLVLAVLNLRWTADAETWPLALFGVAWEHPEMIQRQRIDPSWRKVPTGFWLDQTGPRHEKIPAVIAADHLGPWNLAKVSPVVWENPWGGGLPLDFGFSRRTGDLSSGLLVSDEDGRLLRDVIGIPEHWPPGDPF